MSHGILRDLQASTAAINHSSALQSPKETFNILKLLLIDPVGKKKRGEKKKKSNADLSLPFFTQNPPGVHKTFLFPFTL